MGGPLKTVARFAYEPPSGMVSQFMAKLPVELYLGAMPTRSVLTG